MKSECCHQHPDNGSDLALQTEAQREETDLREENARLQDDKQRQQRYIAELIDKRFDADNKRKVAEAQSERRKWVLKDCATALHIDRMHDGLFRDCERWGCAAARAAIEEEGT